MVITDTFQYEKPTSLDSTLDLLSDTAGKHHVLAGGTDIIVKIKNNELNAEAKILIDIKGLSELAKIEETSQAVFIGSLVTFSDILSSNLIKKELPILWEAASTVASVGIRNRATLVGNICSAVPSLDSGPALLVHNAVVVAQNKDGKRQIAISDWFTGPKSNALQDDELVVGIKIPKVLEKNASCYLKLGRYNGEDLAQVGLGVLYKGGTFRLAYCAVGPVPKRAITIEKLLNGQELSDEILKKAKKLLEEEITPITDIRASKEYRMELATVMLEKGLFEVVKRFESTSKHPIGAVTI